MQQIFNEMISNSICFAIVLVINLQYLKVTGFEESCSYANGDNVSMAPASQGCILPNHPENGKCPVMNFSMMQPGQRVDVGTTLDILCVPGYKLNSYHPILSCWDNNVWSRPIPECIKRCPPIYDDANMNIECYDQNNTVISCAEAAEGTTITYECAPYYEPAENIRASKYCADGSWNLPQPRCIPACGKKTVGNKLVGPKNYPWVASIYIKRNKNFTKICEGTMLSQRHILTAAICVDSYRPYTLSTAPVKVAVGQDYSEYMNQKDTEAQYTDVDETILHPDYKGPYNQYRYNLAILKTKEELRITKFVQPVCMIGLSKFFLTENQLGIVSTWGRNAPTKLKVLSISYKEKSACMDQMISSWVSLYQDADYFCAEYNDKHIQTCGPDVGSGLFFQHRGRFYVHGVFQTTHSRCDFQTNTLYTNVNYFYDWIISQIGYEI